LRVGEEHFKTAVHISGLTVYSNTFKAACNTRHVKTESAHEANERGFKPYDYTAVIHKVVLEVN
jgi:hypothetical protein